MDALRDPLDPGGDVSVDGVLDLGEDAVAVLRVVGAGVPQGLAGVWMRPQLTECERRMRGQRL